MRKRKPIPVFLVGLGRIMTRLEQDPLRNKPCTHVGTMFLKKFRSVYKIKAGYDSNPEQFQKFQEQWNIELPSVPIEDWKFFFQKSDILLAVIATPTSSHVELASKLIESKIPNLVIEKPLALEKKEVLKLSKLAEKHRTKIWINHERRYHSHYSEAKRIIDSKELGDWKTVHANILNYSRSPGNEYTDSFGGPFFHDATHAIDFLQWCFGTTNQFSSWFHYEKKGHALEHQAYAVLEYPKGKKIFLEAGGSRKYFTFEISISFERGKILLSNDGHKKWISKESKLYKGFKSLEEIPFWDSPENTISPFESLYTEIEQVLNGESKMITSGLKENLLLVEWMEKIQKKSVKKIVSRN